MSNPEPGKQEVVAAPPPARHSAPRRPSRARRRLALVITGIIFVVVAMLHWYRSGLAATGAPEAVVTIERGASTEQIAERLKQKELIKSERAFGLYVRFRKLAPQFQSGRFLLSGDKSAGQLAVALTKKSNLATQFTIPEGFTQFAIGERLGQLGIADAEEFKKLKASDFPEYEFLNSLPDDATLEGYLFPETYTIPAPGTGAKDVARLMLNQFQKVASELQPQVNQSGRSLHEIVTIASLAEEEVRSDKDRRIVAGIIEKRLAEDIRLDIDATVRYTLDKPTGVLTAADLDSDSLYNTRRHKGLPPGPITNPGRTALEAALNPEKTDFLFYLSAPDGTTYYAKTNEEHEQNKSEHLQ